MLQKRGDYKPMSFSWYSMLIGNCKIPDILRKIPEALQVRKK